MKAWMIQEVMVLAATNNLVERQQVPMVTHTAITHVMAIDWINYSLAKELRVSPKVKVTCIVVPTTMQTTIRTTTSSDLLITAKIRTNSTQMLKQSKEMMESIIKGMHLSCLPSRMCSTQKRQMRHQTSRKNVSRND